MKATFKKHTLIFKRPSGTSRGVLKTKDTYFILLKDEVNKGVGECGLLRGLSIDDRPDYEEKLQWVCDNIHLGEKKILKELEQFPSIQIGVEMAFLSLVSKDMFSIFPSDFPLGNAPIEINGLIWMGDPAYMKSQISEKLEQGFNCIKMKIGAIDFNTEISVLEDIRKHFSKDQIELRVDANGAFKISEALDRLKILSALDIHSIEQPIKQGNWTDMARLCEKTPLPIALDEELIGVFKISEKRKLLETINPQYIILKPSFVGGFAGTDEWISLADSLGIGWWITSALESNIGLNAISQYTFTKNSNLPQGLGTGSLYTNNVPSPLTVENGTIFYDTTKNWDFNF